MPFSHTPFFFNDYPISVILGNDVGAGRPDSLFYGMARSHPKSTSPNLGCMNSYIGFPLDNEKWPATVSRIEWETSMRLEGSRGDTLGH